MNSCEKTERKTINSLSDEEVTNHKKSILFAHRTMYTEFFTEPVLHEIINSESLLEKPKKILLNQAVNAIISIIIKFIWGGCASESLHVSKVETKYRFSSKKIYGSIELEALMQIIGMADLRLYPELFRQSASAKEVKNLYKSLSNLKISALAGDANECSEEREKKNGEVINSIISSFKETGMDTISSVYKVILKTKNPLFLSKYINLYIMVGKETDKAQKIILSKFLLAFAVAPHKREIIETACFFLHTIITKKDSPLKFRNIAVVFAPIFFIDRSCKIVNSNFKETMEQLRNFLEFFLENSLEIFLL